MSLSPTPEQPESVGADEVVDGAADSEPRQNQRPSVSDLVKTYGDSLTVTDGHKRDRSESGDSAPSGKRGARERGGEPARSPSTPGNQRARDYVDTIIDELEDRMRASISRDFHELRVVLKAEIDKLSDRVKDLEQHVEKRDNTITELTDELRQARSDVSSLQSRVEDAEINSRLPCLVLSGAAMAPRRAPSLGAPLSSGAAATGADGRAQPAAAVRGQVTMTSLPADHGVSVSGAGPGRSGSGGNRGDGRGRSVVRGAGWEAEDVHELVVSTLNRCMPGLELSHNDLDRAHRLPGGNHKVIVRFVRSGQGSARDTVMSRRLELRGRDLFINESLTKLRGQIFRSLLAAKRDKKVYTVYSRGGQVYYKEQQHGTSTRVDSLQKLRDLGFAVSE